MREKNKNKSLDKHDDATSRLLYFGAFSFPNTR